MKAHNSWLLTVIIFSIIFSLSIFGIFISDAFGRHSHFVAPPSCLVTAIFHATSLFLWRRTAIQRQGQKVPPSIYSIASIILTGLLATLWLAFSILTAVVVAIEADERFYRRGLSFTHQIVMAIIGMTLSFVGTTILWAELIILVHYRKRFFQKLRRKSVKRDRRPKPEVPEPRRQKQPDPHTTKPMRVEDVHGSAKPSAPQGHTVQRSHFWSYAPPTPVSELQTPTGTPEPEPKSAGLHEAAASQPTRWKKQQPGHILRDHGEDFIVEKVLRQTEFPDPRQQNQPPGADPNSGYRRRKQVLAPKLDPSCALTPLSGLDEDHSNKKMGAQAPDGEMDWEYTHPDHTEGSQQPTENKVDWQQHEYPL